MNKYIIVTCLTLSLVSSVSAQTVVKKTPSYMPQKIETTFPAITTGDAALDAKILALQKAEIAKMASMHEETYAKIKTLIGTKKASVKFPAAAASVKSPTANTAELDKICSLRLAAKGVKPSQGVKPTLGGDNNGQMNQNTVSQAVVPSQQVPVSGFRAFINKLFGWQ